MNNYLSKIEEIILEAKQGKMFILVDDENRENEGDLVIPAQFCDDKAINFMAKYGRGLICLALNEKRVQQLNLPLMSLNNESRNKTAFTISIEAKDGITTGISAYDRAKTIKDAINPLNGKEAIVSPGHIFPLKAQNGGVLVRAGHTEAAVDISRLANLNESGVICEIMNDDGKMARMPDLIEFAKKHDLKIATIADLIEYRRRNEKLITLVHKQKIEINNIGEFDLTIFKSNIDNIEHIVLSIGDLSRTKSGLVRMHHFNFFSDFIQNINSDKDNILKKSLKKIIENQCGAVVIIRQPQESISNLLENNSSNKILRNYGIGAQILNDLGLEEIVLLTNSEKSVIGLEGYKIKIVGYQRI